MSNMMIDYDELFCLNPKGTIVDVDYFFVNTDGESTSSFSFVTT